MTNDESIAAVQTASDMLVLSAGVNNVPLDILVVALLFTWVRVARQVTEGYTLDDAMEDVGSMWQAFDISPAALTSPGGEA